MNYSATCPRKVCLANIRHQAPGEENVQSSAANHITPISFKSLHFAVQLWKDGPYWATTNIGADTPEAYGQYFAWGYTTGYTRNSTVWTDGVNTKTFDATGFSDYKTHTYADTAEANWGTGWSVPTDAQLKTLINASDADIKDKCSVTFVTTGVKGIRVTGIISGYTSNSIFLPAAGCRNYYEGEVYEQRGEVGCYWSTSNVTGGVLTIGLNERVAFISNSNRAEGVAVCCVQE